jgi:polyisoprenyl-teichoic acid--peptidoglycan teichoic acid transferase
VGGNRKLRRLLLLLVIFTGINLLSPVKLPVSPDSQKSTTGGQVSSHMLTENNGPQSMTANNERWQVEAKAEGDKLAERVNVLLLGIDARAREASRSDSIILLSINTKNGSASALSVLRDTYVTIPNSRVEKNRINIAFALGGPSLAVKTVSSFLQVPIKYYVVADFKGFEKAIDAIGGVELDVEKRMDYTDDGVYDIHLKPGRQVLNGGQALGYARFRHDERGDLARVERQRKLLQAILAKAQGIQGVYYLPKIFEAVSPYIKTNLDLSTAAGLIYLGSKVNTFNTHTLPGEADFSMEKVDGMEVIIPNLQHVRSEVKQVLP